MTHLQQLVGTLSFPEVKALLTAEPYFLHVKESKSHPDLYIVTYDMVRSAFEHPAVAEARGIILEKETNDVICFPFLKFWNYNEGRAAPIDWDTAVVHEKLDGSLIKVFFYQGHWIVATNGTVDANDAPASRGYDAQPRSFRHIFEECWRTTFRESHPDVAVEDIPADPFSQLEPDKCYLFEAMHPATMIVVRHPVPRLRHLATRHRVTHQELHVTLPHIPKPPVFSLKSLAECLEYAQETKALEFEGFVVCDEEFNRIKIKSPDYVAMHHLKTNNAHPEGQLLLALVKGEDSEILAYFPEFAPAMVTMRALLHQFNDRLTAELLSATESIVPLNRKAFVMASKTFTSTLSKKQEILAFRLMMNCYDPIVALPSVAETDIREICSNAVIDMVSKLDVGRASEVAATLGMTSVHATK